MEQQVAGAAVRGGARQRRRHTMKLRVVRGSFSTSSGGQGGSTSPIMDAEVWSRLPEDILWQQVMLLLPAAKLFQLQLVSRKWRQLLTSAYFRSQWVAAVPARERQQQQQGVVACVSPGETIASSSSNSNKLKVVDIDLSFVPRSFWKSNSYAVVAAGHGLVCISNELSRRPQRLEKEEERELDEKDEDEEVEGWKQYWNQYCVINPLTRTCKVLPLGPFDFYPKMWLLSSPTAVTTFGNSLVATYDLAADRWDTAGLNTLPTGCTEPTVALCVCGGETFSCGLWCRMRVLVRVLAPRPGGGRKMVKVATLDGPSLGLLGVDATQLSRFSGGDDDDGGVFMLAHRGAVFFVKRLGMRCKPHVLGVWRLARERLEWEAVARLDTADVERLTGLKDFTWGLDSKLSYLVWGARGVRELLCVQFGQGAKFLDQGSGWWFILGFNLDTGEWELVRNEPGPIGESPERLRERHKRPRERHTMKDPGMADPTNVSWPVELRLDL